MIRSDTDGPALAVYAMVVYDVMSTTNSSPQTTEINAKARAKTLMKWVKLGLAQAFLFIFVSFLAEPPGKKWRPLIGGGVASLLLWFQYDHAKRTGLQSMEPGTEDYSRADTGSHGVRAGSKYGRPR